MDRVGFAERERRDLRVEALASLGHHLVGAFHQPEGRGQRAAGGVLERLARLEDRLLADDTRAADLFDFVFRVGDDPVPRQQLDGLAAVVRDRDRIEEEPLVPAGSERSGAYSDKTCTRTPRVTASEVNIVP